MAPVIYWFQNHTLAGLLLPGTVFTFAWVIHFRNRLHVNWCTAAVFSILHTAAGLLSVSVFAVMEAGFDLRAAGNMSLFGGVFFMPLYYCGAAGILHVKKGDMFDAGTVCMIFTLLCARVNCIFAGCCLGNVIPGTAMRWPTRELEILFYIILLIFFVRKGMAGTVCGMNYPLYMISYGIFRLIEEGFRYSDTGRVFHLSHLWALITLLAGVSIYTEMRKRERRNML